MESRYNHKIIEEKWISRWEEERTYRPDLKGASRPFYNLMMFPYPSAEGLHVGNVFAFVGSDIQGRYKKARGYDVFEPIGFDSFGMHSENYALKTGMHPWYMVEENIKRFREKQLKRIGNMFDWSHEICTTDPEYYRWTQWIFLKLYKMGLAYRKNDEVNWCPSCKTVLAENPDGIKSAYEEDGILVNSGLFSGMRSTEAGNKIISWVSEHGKGNPQVTYRLHDWCISRQRYWGPPIPIIYCEGCGAIPVPEEDLPVILPYVEKFEPDGAGLSPLARKSEFLRTVCPRCGKSARRETDVSDNFLDSAWYFLRYPSSDCPDRAFDKELTDKWLPVDMYIGGNEHAVLHLMYTRFITMSLHEMGLIGFAEPFKVFRANGLIVKDGAKMSKSKGNVVNPDNYLEEYGADVFRTYLMFFGNFQEGGDFRDTNIVGIQLFWIVFGGLPLGQISARILLPIHIFCRWCTRR